MIDPGENHRVDEATPLAEDSHHSPYDRSKAAGERVALDASSDALRVVVLAPTAVVGPYDHRPSYFGRVLLTMAHNRLPVRVGGGFDWVDVRDVVAGIIAASQRGEAGRKYLLSGHWRSLAEVADLVAAATGGRRPLVPIPLSLARACSPIGERMACLMRRTPLFTPYSVEALGHHRQVSHERASEELGYTPRPLEVTIVDTLQWFADNGFLDCTVMGSGAHQ
jgi:dihydroflavonol-4-reductase